MNSQQTAGIEARGWSTRGYIPHFDEGSIPQLVTFRLADSFPSACLDEWAAELEAMNPTLAEYERRRRIEDYLDKGHGSLWLSYPSVAEVVMQALLHFDGRHYRLHAWCIMPNHVHVLLTPGAVRSLAQIIHSWKSYSANKANVLLRRTGAFWQREYFDRYIRDQAHFVAAVEYIENNPVKAGLCQSPPQWRYSSAFLEVSSSTFLWE